MARPLVLTDTSISASPFSLAAMSVMLCAFAVFMCASHSRRRRQWNECYGFFEEEPVIEVQNNAVILQPQVDEEETDATEEAGISVWQKNIIMGGKCQLPDFSGVIIYDAEGNVVTPAKNSRPLLMWK